MTFDIEIFNQGNIDATNVMITDYIPTGLTLNDTSWTQSGSMATKQVTGTISAGGSQVETITFTIESGVSGTITNYAEISEDDGDDCDSTPDQDRNNDALVDNAIGVGCEPG